MEIGKINENGFDQWCIIEIFGHQRIAGRVREQTIGGCSFLRVDVPEAKAKRSQWNGTTGGYEVTEETIPAFTKFYGQGAIYSMTPCTEAVARAAIQQFAAEPVTCVDLRPAKALPAPQHDDGWTEPREREHEDEEEPQCP